MALEIADTPLPLANDADGVIRVGGTRVTLDTVISAFTRGATAEEIVQQYPSLQLADVYATLGYYLRHHAAVETYLLQRKEQARLIRQQNEERFDPTGLRDRLLARWHDTGS